MRTEGAATSVAWRLSSIVAVALLLFALGLLRQWADGGWVGAMAAGMGAAALLGLLLLRRAGTGWAVAATAAAWIAHAAGWLPDPGSALIPTSVAPALLLGAGPALGAIATFALLRGRRIDPRTAGDVAPLAWTLLAASVVVPLGLALLDWVAPLAWMSAATPGPDWQGGLWPTWLGAALGLLPVVPLVLAWCGDEAEGQDPPAYAGSAQAVLAWLPVPLVLGWRPELLVLALLPMVVLAPRLGPRAATALATGIAATVAVAAVIPGINLSLPPEGLVLPTLLAIIATLPLALLAGQRRASDSLLRRTGEHLRAVTEHSPFLVATLDGQARHRFANHSYLRWLGRDAAEVIGHSLHEVYGEDAARFAAPIRHVMAGLPQRQQITLSDGRILDARIEPRFSEAGPIDGVHLLAQDASWKADHERGLDAMLSASADPGLVLDSAGGAIRTAPRILALLGEREASLLGKPPSAWLEPEAEAALGAALTRAHDSGEPQVLGRDLGLHARRADGSSFPVTLRIAPVRAARGFQALVAVHDLEPELAIEQLAAEARTQAESTLAAVGDAIVACDLHGRVTVFNPAAVQLTGWPMQDVLGKPCDEVLRFVDAEDAPLHSLLGMAVKRNTPLRQDDHKLLLRRDGERIAVSEAAAPTRDRFGQANGGVVVLHDVSQSQAQVQSLAHQALHDHLTGLPNRVLLQDRLSQALAQMDRGYKGALLYLDLDHFKPINDRLGHPVGDRVLQEVASRLRACVREDDTVSRQGGDEFVLLLVRLADARDAARVAGKLIEAVEQPIMVDGHELAVSASIGIALFPQDGRDIRTITRQADAALYHAKEAGRGRYRYFTDRTGASAEERMRTEHDLRIALSNGDFLLAWQPQFHLPERRIGGVEALVRWRQLDGNVVLPEEFIPVAEETGLIGQIDEWVLTEACRQCRQWQQDWEARGIAPIPVSVNVSLARFDADRLLTQVRRALADSGLEPRWLEIEFKSAQLFAQGARGQALVAALREMGVGVAADDFGSGESSLGVLAGMGFAALKIDRDFVDALDDDPAAAAVVRAVAGIGQAMGQRVVAKGVANEAQYRALVAAGCTGMQGLMFGAAGSASQLDDLLARDAAALAAG